LGIGKANAWVVGEEEDFDYHSMMAWRKRANNNVEGVAESTDM
jgi:hypothetical protein